MENRRNFLKRIALLTAALPFIGNWKSFSGDEPTDILSLIKKNVQPVGVEGMGAIDVPKNVSWKTILSTPADKGEKILISGTVYDIDGRTPVPNALIYLYHTDIEGYYGRLKGEPKHGRYRGWMLTNEKGRYAFQTIKPAPYPENRFAAHIHMTLTTKDRKEDWFDDILFEGDPLISERERKEAGNKGGFQPILKLEKNSNGFWTAQRNIQLWK